MAAVAGHAPHPTPHVAPAAIANAGEAGSADGAGGPTGWAALVAGTLRAVNIAFVAPKIAAAPAASTTGASSPSSSGTLALFCYSASSIVAEQSNGRAKGMTLLNKYIVGTLNFKFSFLSLFLQGIIVVGLLIASSRFNMLSFKPLRQDLTRQWAPVTLLLCAMLYTGFKALEYIAIPLFTIFKNLTIIAIAYGEYWIWNTPVTPMILSSFALMVLSASMAGLYDIEFTAVGYVWMLLNCFTTAAYVLYLRVAIKTAGFEDFDSVYYNNILSLPVLFVMSLWDVGTILTQSDAMEHGLTTRLLWSLLVSGIMSFMISYCTVWCVRVTSSTTYSMVGALNKLPLVVAGMLFFHTRTNMGSILSIFTGVAAGMLYAYAKSRPPKMVSVGDLGLPRTRSTQKTSV